MNNPEIWTKWITIFLVQYVIGIGWCTWAMNKDIEGMTDDEREKHFKVFSEKFVVNVISWIPVMNIIIAFVATKDIVTEKIRFFFVRRTIKKLLKKIRKDNPASDADGQISDVIKKI